MMGMGRCRRMRKKLGAFLDGELGAHEMHRVEVHLDECARCRRALIDLREADARFSRAKVEDPGDAYWDSFLPRLRERMASSDGEARSAGAGNEASRRRWISPVWGGVIGGVAVAVLAVVIFYANETPLEPVGRKERSVSPAPPSETRAEERAVGGVAAVPRDARDLRAISPGNETTTPSTLDSREARPAPPGAPIAAARQMATPEIALPDVSGPESNAPGSGPETKALSAPAAQAPAVGDGEPRFSSGARIESAAKSRLATEQMALHEVAPGGPGVTSPGDESVPLTRLALYALDLLRRADSLASVAGQPPDYTEVIPVLTSLEPAARHPETSGLADSLATRVIAALEKVRPQEPRRE